MPIPAVLFGSTAALLPIATSQVNDCPCLSRLHYAIRLGCCRIFSSMSNSPSPRKRCGRMQTPVKCKVDVPCGMLHTNNHLRPFRLLRHTQTHTDTHTHNPQDKQNCYHGTNLNRRWADAVVAMAMVQLQKRVCTSSSTTVDARCSVLLTVSGWSHVTMSRGRSFHAASSSTASAPSSAPRVSTNISNSSAIVPYVRNVFTARRYPIVRYMLSSRFFHPRVCSSQAGVVSKRLKMSPHKQRHMIAQGL